MRALKIYRQSDKGNGSAFQFSCGSKKRKGIPVMFVDAAPQTGLKPRPGSSESPFNWKDNKITMMLNIEELGAILASIKGLDTKSLKFIHTSNEGATISSLTIEPPTTHEQLKYGNWKISINKKVGEENKYVNSFLSTNQLMLLSILAEGIIKDYYLGDDEDGNSDTQGE